jgi:hypothetical protein
MNSGAAMPAVELDALHRYWLDGRELDGCTTTLASVGLLDRSRYTDEARERGTYVHEVIHADAGRRAGRGARRAVPVRLLDGRARILRESALVVLNVERPLADPVRGIAGKPDVVGLRRSRARHWPTGRPGARTLARLSSSRGTSTSPASTGIVGGLVDRVAVYLRDDGTYQTHRFTDRNDWHIAQAAITVAQAKRFA